MPPKNSTHPAANPPATTAFFTPWGGWNLYFYPANNLWMSFAGGLCLAGANLTWVVMALRVAGMDTCQKNERHDSFWDKMPGLVWSNRNASDDVQIAAALLNPPISPVARHR